MKCRLPLVLALAIALALPVTAIAQSTEERLLRVYTARFLHPNNLAALAFQVCGGEDRCEIESLGDQGVVIKASDAIHSEFAELLRERDMPPPTQEFRIILLRANRGNAMPDVPADARQALVDLREMTAYTGFELIDSAWLRTSGRGSTTLGEAGSFKVEVKFTGDPGQGSSLLVEVFQLYHSDVHRVEAGPDSTQVVLGDPKSVLSSQFGIEVGETVVVGTSRLNGGDEALVVLLTALNR